MTDREKSGPYQGPDGDKLNWRDTNGVETNDSQADGTDVVDASVNQDGSDGSSAAGAARSTTVQHEDATEGGSVLDGKAPDQRTRDDQERSDEHRGANTPDAETPTPH